MIKENGAPIRIVTNTVERYELKGINKLFRVKDNRNIEKEVHKFKYLNRKNLDFLGVSIDTDGINSRFSLNIKSSNYIGAVPVKTTCGTICRDLQVIPRFSKTDSNFSELTDLISILRYSIEPEYSNSEPLKNDVRLRPPLFYEAIKYIDLLNDVYNYEWVKFETKELKYRFPKSGTRWDKYAIYSSDPQKMLVFINRDNKFSINHHDWQELKYVLILAENIIEESHIKMDIKRKYYSRIKTLGERINSISPTHTFFCKVYQSDPVCVKKAKAQANKILEANGTVCMAWRIDVSELFERYVQHIVRESSKNLTITVCFNPRMSGNGEIPSWGLKYLEPDIMGNYNNEVIMADVKYKANLFNYNKKSDVLHGEHRRDLHQLLAYCSFEPQVDKTGILFYPNDKFEYKIINYKNNYNRRISNKVLICGMQFSSGKIQDNIKNVSEMIRNQIVDM